MRAQPWCRRAVLGLLGCGLLCSGGVGPALAGQASSTETAEETAEATVERVRNRVYPALVNISVVHERFGEGRVHRYPGAGSGVILTPEGHVLTNYHVAGGASRVECTLTDGRVLAAEIVVDDPLTDLTVLRLIDREGAGEFLHAELGEDATVAVGDTVFAMGNPLALSSSMTRGIVSNRARVFTDFTGTEIEEMTLEPDQLSGLLTRWIQHDALILPGNSGGPLVDAEGRVVGINELGGRGMGFAIPASIARDVLHQALAEGAVKRGWLGLSVLPVGKQGAKHGALVSSVLPGSSAAVAGIEPGDVLLEIDGEPVSAVFFEEVPLVYQRLAELTVGSEVELVVGRTGERSIHKVKVFEMPKFKGDEWEVESLGMTVQEITEPMAISRRFPNRDGLLLTSMRPGSPADSARPRLTAFDVLLRIDGEPIESPAGLSATIEGLESDQKALLELRRGAEHLVALVPAPSGPNGGWGGELPKAWLGVETQVLNSELSEALGFAGRTGFRVTRVLPWTAAEQGGFRVGDVIVAVDGEATAPTRAQESEDLRRLIEERYIDDEASFSILRGGTSEELKVRLERRPRDAEEADSADQAELDFEVRDVTFSDRIQNDWPKDQQGVLVTEALLGGWAQMEGLRINDLILSINDRPVADVDQFREVSRWLRSERPELIEIFVKRGGYRTHFIFVEPDWSELTASSSAKTQPGRAE